MSKKMLEISNSSGETVVSFEISITDYLEKVESQTRKKKNLGYKSEKKT